MKRLLAALLLCLPLPAEAAISLKRGIALDIWVTWPDEPQMLEPGMLDVFPEWRKTVGPEKIALIKQAGFDFVRLPIDPSPFFWKPDARRTAHLIAQTLETVAELRAAGLKVIVDMHTIPDGGYRKTGTDQILAQPKLFKAYGKLVGEIASALKDQDPDAVAFETFNEPTNDCDGGSAQWPAMLKALHEIARAAAPRLTLVQQGGCWGGSEGLVRLEPEKFGDDNIIWSFHSYEPFQATHQGASWTGGPERYLTGLRYPPELMTEAERAEAKANAVRKVNSEKLSRARKKDLIAQIDGAYERYFTPGATAKQMQAPFDLVAGWAAKNKIPPERIFLGEFGMIKKDLGPETPVEDRAGIIAGIRTAAEARGYSWAVWSHGGSFAITNSDESRVFEPPLLKALGLP